MYNSDLFVGAADERARARLEREFPDVPARVIAAVLAAYRRVTPSLVDATTTEPDGTADARAN